ncbi:MAG: PDZ domain-containing protein [Chloroflexi bacterium]|nr:PDZ domain-containing protein [Chloroflexota bacterium]
MKKLIIVLVAIVVLGLAGFILPAAAQEGTPTPTSTPTPTPWLGLEVADVNAKLAQELGLNLGVIVLKVVEGGPAAQAGMLAKDIILTASQKPVNSVADLLAIVKASKVGDVLALTGRRGDAPMTWKVTVGEKPQPEPQSLIPGIPELAGIARGQLFGHILGGQINMTDKDGNPLTIQLLAGTVAALAEGSVTVKPNDGSANVTYNTNEVKVIGKLEVGAPVVVVSVNNQPRLIARAGARRLLQELNQSVPKPALHSLRGEVKEVSAQGITLVYGDKEVKVVFSQDLKVRPDKAQLVAGAKVMVVGQKQEEGTLLASQIVVLPQKIAPKALMDKVNRLRTKLQQGRSFTPHPSQPTPLRLPQT